MRLLGIVSLAGFMLTGASCRKNDFLYREGARKAPLIQAQRLELAQSGKMDLLWVIDNSGSMLSYIPDLIDDAAEFMKSFTTNAGLDWKMGVISTDIGNAPALGFGVSREFTSRTPNPLAVFQSAVQRLGRYGTHTEKAYEPILQVLNVHPDFLRRDATLALLLVTDAPEQSVITTQNFLTELRKITGITKRITAFGAFAPKDFNCESTDDPWTLAGSKFGELITATGGSTISLCTGEFGVEMAKIGRVVTAIQENKIRLKTRPLPSSIRLIYHGNNVKGGTAANGGFWTYDHEINAVIVHDTSFAIGNDLDVQVEYVEETVAAS